MEHKIHAYLQELWLVASFSSQKREIEYWRLDLYKKLFWKLSDYKTAENRNRYKMQEFNEIFALWESLYWKKYQENYREEFKSFLWIIQSFLDDKNFDYRKWEGLNHLIASLINNLASLYDWEEQKDFEHAMKTTFWEEMFKRSHEKKTFHSGEKADYRSKAEISKIPSDTKMLIWWIISWSVMHIIWEKLWEKLWIKKHESSKNISPLRLPNWKEDNKQDMYPIRLPNFNNEEDEKKEKSSVRSIEFLLRSAYHTFFEEKYKNWKIQEWEIRQNLNKIKHAYALSKWKFQEILRNDGERFFNHLRNSAFNITRYNKNASFDAFLVAILHDVIEDTDIDFRTLRFYFWEKIALAVYSISKDSPLNHIQKNDEENLEKKEALEKSWLLNEDKKIKIKYQKIYERYRDIFEPKKDDNQEEEREQSEFSQETIEKIQYNPYKTLSQDERETIESELPWDMTLEEFVKYINFYQEIHKKYKGNRNEAYMSHFKNLDSFRRNVSKNIETLKSQGIKISLADEEIKEVADLALEAKFADRIHNQETAEAKNDNSEASIKKTENKIKETEDYFYTISQEFDTEKGTHYNKALKKSVLKGRMYILKNKILSPLQNFNKKEAA